MRNLVGCGLYAESLPKGFLSSNKTRLEDLPEFEMELLHTSAFLNCSDVSTMFEIGWNAKHTLVQHFV